MAEFIEAEKKDLDEKVLLIRRVSKKTTGGSAISFTALVVVGDHNGKLGIGLGRAKEVPKAIQKSIAQARKKLFTIERHGTTLSHEIKIKYKSARLILKPAPEGAGLKVGSVLRSVLTVAGVSNASGKIIGTRNKTTNTYAVVKALQKLKEKNRS